MLAFGDSLVAGYGLPAARAFPAQLEAALRPAWPAARVLNAGVPGDTSAAGLARLPRVLCGLPRRPALAIVELGANDLLRGLDPARTRANLDAILHQLAQAGVPALLLGLEAPPLGPVAAAFNALFPAVAAAHGAPLFTIRVAEVVGDPALTLPDRLHPNGAAVAMVVGRLLPLVDAALRRAA